MTSSHSFRKRKSAGSQPFKHSPTPAMKRLRSWKTKHCALLELPPEIRLSILKELLWQREPLKIREEALDQYFFHWRNSTILNPQRCNFHLSPGILRTCRVLYKEGIAMLYNNAIACEVWCDFEVRGGDNPYLSSFLHPDWNLTEDAYFNVRNGKRFCDFTYLLRNVKRLDVVLRAAGDDECSALRQAVRTFVKGTRDLPQLAHANIRLDLPEKPGVPSAYYSRNLQIWTYEYCQVSREEYSNLAVGPFAALRGLKSVKIEGVSDAMATELEMVMTSKSTAVDLTRMLDSLEEYVHKYLRSDHCKICLKAFGYLERARYAVEVEHEVAFRKARAKLFASVEEHQAVARLIACEHDPIPDVASNDLSEVKSASKQSYPPLDDADMDTLYGTEWDLERPSWDLRDDETDAEHQQREKQEQERPSLVKLRQIALREQVGDLEYEGSDYS